jgi:excinuclease ABC subunit C
MLDVDNELDSLAKVNFGLVEKIRNLPTNPGVYIYKNDKGKIIYIGKAVNLRNRVRSYFQSGKYFDAKTKALINHIHDLEFIVTNTEAEALILEDTLIKENKPRYNILLRDDKSYPYIRITNEEFPRIFPTRKVVRDGSKYFGPYTDVKNMRRILRLIQSIFRIRTCKLKLNEESIKQGKFRLCLDYQIKKCDGPCEAKILREEYLANVRNAAQVINGKTTEVEKYILKRMEELAEELKFEQAAYLRNQYFLLKDYSASQKIVTIEPIDRDVFAIAKEGEFVCSLVFTIREGKLIGKRYFFLRNDSSISDSKILQLTLEKWYLESEFVPDEVFLPFEPDDREFIEIYLNKKKGKKVSIQIPKVGDKRKLVQLAYENAQMQLKEYLLATSKKDADLPKKILIMQKDLGLPKPPRKIECFDNSHIQGSELVSSLVVFKDAKPLKSEYRKFRIKTVDKSDDFAAMKEVVYRRYKRLLDEGKELPDLVIIDGGKGQLNIALGIFRQLQIDTKVPLISIAKRLEEIFSPLRSEPLMLARSSPTLQLIQQIRDEAHRFAIEYHRKLRQKRTIDSELLHIEGVGPKTMQKLLTAFGSINEIKKKRMEEISKIVGKSIAKKIVEGFKEQKKD